MKTKHIKYNKFTTHCEDRIWCLKYIHPVISLQHITRENLSDELMLVHLNEEEINEVITTTHSDQDQS